MRAVKAALLALAGLDQPFQMRDEVVEGEAEAGRLGPALVQHQAAQVAGPRGRLDGADTAEGMPVQMHRAGQGVHRCGDILELAL